MCQAHIAKTWRLVVRKYIDNKDVFSCDESNRTYELENNIILQPVQFSTAIKHECRIKANIYVLYLHKSNKLQKKFQCYDVTDCKC